jgi:hypothetical protein
MPYIGKNPSNFRRSLTEKDTFTGDGSTTVFDTTSNIPGGSANDIQIYVDTTIKIPGTDYTIGLDGSNRLRRITFTSAPAGSSTITVLNPGITDTQITTVSDGAVTLAKMADSSVNSSKIVDGSIVNADINNSAAIVDTKLATISTAGKVNVNALSAPGSASVFLAGDGSFTAIDTSQQDTNAFNISLLGFKMAVNDGLTVFNLVDGVVDEFHDESGTDEAEGSNDYYCGTNDHYENISFGSPSPRSAGFAIASVTEPDTSTAGTNPETGSGTYGAYSVPGGMLTATIKVWGAGGSGGFGAPGSPTGGGGGFAEGEATVSPGQSLEVIVGEGAGGQGDGHPNGASEGGGMGGVHPSQNPGNTAKGGGGGTYASGGGLSGVTDGPSLPQAATPNLLIIAGSGGGGGGHNNAQGPGGVGGGANGGGGTGNGGGGGGSQSGGGSSSAGQAGGFLYGGNGDGPGGGGGGAGFYGGGGGQTSSGEHAGGGGGSSYTGNPLMSGGSTSQASGSTSGGASEPSYPGLPSPSYGSLGQGGEGSNPDGGNGESGGDGYVLITGTAQPLSTVSTTIVSDTFTSSSVPTSSRIVVFEEDVATPTLNTDIIASISRDGGTNFTTATLTDSGYVTGTSGQRILTGQATVSGQPSGQSMRWKLALANNRVKIHGVSLQWS